MAHLQVPLTDSYCLAQQVCVYHTQNICNLQLLGSVCQRAVPPEVGFLLRRLQAGFHCALPKLTLVREQLTMLVLCSVQCFPLNLFHTCETVLAASFEGLLFKPSAPAAPGCWAWKVSGVCGWPRRAPGGRLLLTPPALPVSLLDPPSGTPWNRPQGPPPPGDLCFLWTWFPSVADSRPLPPGSAVSPALVHGAPPAPTAPTAALGEQCHRDPLAPWRPWSQRGLQDRARAEPSCSLRGREAVWEPAGASSSLTPDL